MTLGNETVFLLLGAMLFLAVLVEIMVRIFFRWGVDERMSRRSWWRRYFGF